MLLDEINKLDNIFNSIGIEFIYFKGVLNIKNSIYKDLGSRMIGDIDVLIGNNDLIKINKLLENKLDYEFIKPKTKFWKKRHLPRLLKLNKTIALEIHTEVIEPNKKYLLSGHDVLSNYNKNQGDTLIKICILNYQINDFGAFRCTYSYRTIYDYLLLLKHYKIKSHNVDNIYFRKFFAVTNLLGITNININYSIAEKFFIKRFIIKKRYKSYALIDEFFCKKIILLKKRFYQIMEFFLSKNYRSYVIDRLKF